MLVLRFEVAIEEGTKYSFTLDIQPWGRTERIVNEPLEEALDGGYGMSSLFTVYRYGIA